MRKVFELDLACDPKAHVRARRNALRHSRRDFIKVLCQRFASFRTASRNSSAGVRSCTMTGSLARYAARNQ